VIEHLDEPEPKGMKRPRLTTISVERPRCPTCGSVKLSKYRSLTDQGDGSALWWVRCECGKRFRVVLE
jgi:DNA-directed RNA polymerase subunit M/transcription elongation factor TFIIS